MKTITLRIFSCIAASVAAASAQTTATYTNFIRQVQTPSGVQWDIDVNPSGEQQSGLSVEDGGARFELWTIKSSPLTSYLLDTKFVGSYIPSASVVIKSKDPYGPIPRTRADEPFDIYIGVSGLSEIVTAPAAAKSVTLLRHVQSYGSGGTGENVNRSQATLLTQAAITGNTNVDLPFKTNHFAEIPGPDLLKVRGEERFSVFSVADILSPAAQLASQYIQVWPVARGTIAGIKIDDVFRGKLPPVTFKLDDLYPDSTTYLQVYKGNQVLGTQGAIIPGVQYRWNDTKPTDYVLTASDWDATLKEDGRWTLELLTSTPFGIDRLAWVSFDLDRRHLQVNGLLGTME